MICISLGSVTFSECVKALGKSEYTELRMDLLDYSDDQFKSLFKLKRKSVATCRPGKMDRNQRMVKLKNAILFGAGFIDIEYESDGSFRSEISDFAHENDAQVIISYHNYEITPGIPELDVIYNQSLNWGADYVKVATMANFDSDNARILGLYENHKNLIAFCMGKKGAITRFAAPLLGSLFTFAALNSEMATAPGQLTLEQLLELYRGLGIEI
jgi:3-dehydroquinate dehydratase type I